MSEIVIDDITIKKDTVHKRVRRLSSIFHPDVKETRDDKKMVTINTANSLFKNLFGADDKERNKIVREKKEDILASFRTIREMYNFEKVKSLTAIEVDESIFTTIPELNLHKELAQKIVALAPQKISNEMLSHVSDFKVMGILIPHLASDNINGDTFAICKGKFKPQDSENFQLMVANRMSEIAPEKITGDLIRNVPYKSKGLIECLLKSMKDENINLSLFDCILPSYDECLKLLALRLTQKQDFKVTREELDELEANQEIKNILKPYISKQIELKKEKIIAFDPEVKNFDDIFPQLRDDESRNKLTKAMERSLGYEASIFSFESSLVKLQKILRELKLPEGEILKTIRKHIYQKIFNNTIQEIEHIETASFLATVEKLCRREIILMESIRNGVYYEKVSNYDPKLLEWEDGIKKMNINLLKHKEPNIHFKNIQTKWVDGENGEEGYCEEVPNLEQDDLSIDDNADAKNLLHALELYIKALINCPKSQLHTKYEEFLKTLDSREIKTPIYTIHLHTFDERTKKFIKKLLLRVYNYLQKYSMENSDEKATPPEKSIETRQQVTQKNSTLQEGLNALGFTEQLRKQNDLRKKLGLAPVTPEDVSAVIALRYSNIDLKNIIKQHETMYGPGIKTRMLVIPEMSNKDFTETADKYINEFYYAGKDKLWRHETSISDYNSYPITTGHPFNRIGGYNFDIVLVPDFGEVPNTLRVLNGQHILNNQIKTEYDREYNGLSRLTYVETFMLVLSRYNANIEEGRDKYAKCFKKTMNIIKEKDSRDNSDMMVFYYNDISHGSFMNNYTLEEGRKYNMNGYHTIDHLDRHSEYTDKYKDNSCDIDYGCGFGRHIDKTWGAIIRATG